MDTIRCDPEGSKQPPPYDFEKLIKGIDRDSIKRRLRYTPKLDD